jgi:hypothetical protein
MSADEIVQFEARWRAISLFVSLDFCRPIFPELWVPVRHASAFQGGLREILKPWINKDTPEWGALFYQFGTWIEQQYSLFLLEKMIYWGSTIYQHSGRDRCSERFWLGSAYQAKNGMCTGPEWILELLGTIGTKVSALDADFQGRLSAEEEKTRSQWDAFCFSSKVLDEIFTMESVYDTVSLVGSANFFVEVRNDTCKGLNQIQLEKIYNWGMEHAKKEKISWSIGFPSNWLIPYKALFEASGTGQ